MTITQSIFVVFFAIFWGAIACVQGRWKMFHWTLIRYQHVMDRLVLSIIVLNIIPVLYFTWIFYLLRQPLTSDPAQWTLWETIIQILPGIAPAFAVFGFYRLWAAIVEFSPTSFYRYKSEYNKDKDEYDSIKGIEPTIECLGNNVRHEFWLWNLVSALIYIGFASLVPLIITKAL